MITHSAVSHANAWLMTSSVGSIDGVALVYVKEDSHIVKIIPRSLTFEELDHGEMLSW